MFCKNCGRQIADGIKFCPGCGTEVTAAGPVNPLPQSGVEGGPANESGVNQGMGAAPNAGQNVYTPPVYNPPAYNYVKPKKDKKPFIFLGAGVAAVVIIAIIAVRLLLGGNPISNTLVAMAKLNGMTGANISADAKVEGVSVGADLSFKFGKDLENSVLDASVNALNQRVRLAYSGGNMGMQAMGRYAYVEDVVGQLQGLVDEALDDADIDLDVDVNNLIKGGKINQKYILKLYKEADIDDADYDEDTVEGMTKIFTDFIFKECSKKKVQDQFLSNYRKSGNTYEYTIDAAAMGLAFLDYLEDCEGSRNDKVSDAAELLLKGMGSDYVRDGLEEMEGKINAYVSYSTKGGRLSEIEVELDVAGEGSGRVSLTIDNYNRPKIDKNDIADFMEDAEDEGEIVQIYKKSYDRAFSAWD